jgi:hypothetical protein
MVQLHLCSAKCPPVVRRDSFTFNCILHVRVFLSFVRTIEWIQPLVQKRRSRESFVVKIEKVHDCLSNKSSEIWRCVDWLTAVDVSEKFVVSVFRVQEFQEECFVFSYVMRSTSARPQFCFLMCRALHFYMSTILFSHKLHGEWLPVFVIVNIFLSLACSSFMVYSICWAVTAVQINKKYPALYRNQSFFTYLNEFTTGIYSEPTEPSLHY